MELLGTYNISRLSTTSYQVVFEIPDNSNYNLITSTPGTYTVEIQLNSGQSQPSTRYQSYDFRTDAANDEILIEFMQQDYISSPTTYRTKPVIRIHI